MVGVSRIQRDVTERRRQQEELVQARRRAEEANATKDRFLANLSHELRTPLTPIVASVHRLQQREDLPAGVHDSIAMIGRNAELEARLIDDLLDLTRIARGKFELHRQALDYHELLATVVQSSRSELLAKGLTMETHLDAPDHFGSADGGRLQQVFWNLIRNAIKFTPRGGRVALSSDNPEPGAFRVSIRDTGKGIGSDLLNRIFEPFVQGDSTAVRAGAGLGLGLSIAKTLVDEHGGTITASSEGEGRGACFEVRLATTADRPAAHPPRGTAAGAASGARGPVSVLLVEDDLDTAEAMRDLLAEAGFDVRLAGGVAEADVTFRRHPADVLVSDVGLPDGSGLEVLSRLRALRPSLPGIVLSGYGMEQDVAASRANGFAEHFIKPVNLERLIAAIDRLASPRPDSGTRSDRS
jgi:nitrogen-specific signal transduction histidine kinase/ActR/RegA family two-component response regulator